jgi:hypothetical protein
MTSKAAEDGSSLVIYLKNKKFICLVLRKSLLNISLPATGRKNENQTQVSMTTTVMHCQTVACWLLNSWNLREGQATMRESILL